jgi:hypothetical protein
MTIAMRLIADCSMVRTQIRQALTDCGVRHIAEDREGLFGEFTRSRLYFSHNDTGRASRPAPRLLDGPPKVHMVFHFAPGKLVQGGCDVHRFMRALEARSASDYQLLLNGRRVWARGLPEAAARL